MTGRARTWMPTNHAGQGAHDVAAVGAGGGDLLGDMGSDRACDWERSLARSKPGAVDDWFATGDSSSDFLGSPPAAKWWETAGHRSWGRGRRARLHRQRGVLLRFELWGQGGDGRAAH